MMKIKTDYVTNSSSASFIIDISNITKLQKFLIENHVEFCKTYDPQALLDADIYGEAIENIENSGWTIYEEDGFIKGRTSMDNFDMRWFLNEIGIREEDYEYDNDW